MTAKKLKIVFFGTPEFAVASLDALINDGHEVAAVVTMPDKIGGRGHKVIESDVKRYAVEHDLPLLQPEKLRASEFIDALKAIGADLFVVIAFRMLPKMVWNMPPLGTFNLHASLLPAYRGAAPINRAIMNGEKSTGVTTFLLNEEIDAGDIIMRAEVQIGPDEDAGSLHDRLMRIGADLTVKTVRSIATGEITPLPQLSGKHTPAPKIFKDDCRIDWSAGALCVHNHIRGLSPYPAAWSELISDNGKPVGVKILKARIVDNDSDSNPGEISIDGKRMIVGCGKGSIEIIDIQPNGKRRMPAADFLQGYHPDYFNL